MDLIKIKLKKIYIPTIFILYSYLSPILSILEFPIKAINIPNIPKYNNIILDTKIPPYIENILKCNKNNSTYKNNIKVFAESGDTKIITSSLLSIKVEIGSSNQEFNLILDTGSSITWVPLKKSKDNFPIEHHYDPSISSTCKNLSETFIETYGSGSCFGYYFKDKMKYINDKKFDFIFGVAQYTVFEVKEVDGIIGLAKCYDDETKSFIHMLSKGGVTNSKIFSFKLGINTTFGDIGTFYIGKHDDFNKDNVVSCEMKNSNYFEKYLWACEMNAFSLINNNKTIKLTSEKKVSVIFDSGTNVIILPLFYLEEILNDLNKINFYTKKNIGINQEIGYQLICAGEVPDFHLVIGGHTFILPGSYFFYYNRDIGFSKIVFQNSIENDSDVFIIGSPFFMFFHILFDSFSNQLHFYPEKSEYLIKGSWWNNSNHIITVIIFGLLVVIFIILIVIFILWKKKNKLNDNVNNDHFEITSYLGLL